MNEPTAATEIAARDRAEPLPVSREQRYPLDLSIRVPELRRLYLESNASIWDVAAGLDVSSIAIAGLDSASRAAAALVWSRRSWISFADISESEAALVRSCIERDRAADLKYVLAARGTERAVATDACHRIATRFGGHQQQPATPELRALLATDNIRRALDARMDFDAFFVAHFVVLATLDQALIEAALHHTTEPVCRDALEHIARDQRRQEVAGRTYLMARVPDLGDDTRHTIAANVDAVVRSDVLSGLRCAAFLPVEMPGANDMMAAEELAASAGLGAAPLARQRDVAAATLDLLDAELDELGIETTLAGLASDQTRTPGALS